MNSPLRCSKTLRQTLNAADVIGVNIVAIIGTGGREGHIVEDDLAYIAEIIQQTRPPPAAYEKSVSKLSFQNALALRYHDSNVD